MALCARNASLWLLATLNTQKNLPRTSARAHTCALVFGRAPCVPRSREHEKRHAAGREKKTVYVQNKTHLAIYPVSISRVQVRAAGREKKCLRVPTKKKIIHGNIPSVHLEDWGPCGIRLASCLVLYNIYKYILYIIILYIICTWYINKAAYIPTATYSYTHWVPQPSDFVPLHKDQHPWWGHIKNPLCAPRDRSIPRSLQRWGSTKSSISQLTFFSKFIRAKRVSNCYMQEKKNWPFVCLSVRMFG